MTEGGNPPTQAPTPVATHHCLLCRKNLHRDGPDWPFKDPAGKWQCRRHPRYGESQIIPHLSVPGTI
jgi:hypothetical protein